LHLDGEFPVRKSLILACVAVMSLAAEAPGDEGMWLFNDPPRAQLRHKYGFEPSDRWLEHIRASSVRFLSGGSGSFVSASGLVMTNHHVGLAVLQQISKPGGRDYVKDGFYAATPDQEVRAENEELNVLVRIEEVSERVNRAVPGGLMPEAAEAARRAALAAIESEGRDRAKREGIEPALAQVVTLYQGGQYHLYTYKKYTDVRLVFAPEQQIAFYGGDPDNFEFPRFDLDVCFFRVYESGKPARVEHHLAWSKDGAREGELVFVSGHPARTRRSITMAALEYQRDHTLPYLLAAHHRLQVAFLVFSSRGEEQARRAKAALFRAQNNRKLNEGRLEGLLDPAVMAAKHARERALRTAVASDPKLRDAADAWDRIAANLAAFDNVRWPYLMLELGDGFDSRLFFIARTLLRAGEERTKPNGERLTEYQEAMFDSTKDWLFSNEPIYEDFEIANLASSLTELANRVGAESDVVKTALAGRSPRRRAAELVMGTKLKDLSLRRKLYDGGKAAVDAARDPMLELAHAIDAPARGARRVVDAAEEDNRQAYARIARARLAIEGAGAYPDATFTLRLAFGTVKGYEEDGRLIHWRTTFDGLYERSKEHRDRPPFDLPRKWMERKARIDLATPLNFVCTADIIGGNSGSPVVNRDAEIVGLIFDSNIHSLVSDYAYTEMNARAVAVHSRAILEALDKVYDAGALAEELKRPGAFRP
jgi:hypothetical protein